jgi:hypothetical protein
LPFCPTAPIALDEGLEKCVSAEQLLHASPLLAQEKYVGGPEKFLKNLDAGDAVSVIVLRLMFH